MDIPLSDDVEDIVLEAALGVNGKVPSGLGCTPCGQYVCMPLGSTVMLRNTAKRQFFLEQHTGDVSCLRVSNSGRWLASGQESAGESKAEVVIWDLERAQGLVDRGLQRDANVVRHVLVQHIGKVQAVDFTCDDAYVVTLGGRADNQVLVWDLATGVAICGSPAGVDTALCLRTLRTRPDRFVTGGNFHFRVWQFDAQHKKIQALDAKMGLMKRVLQCVDVDANDEHAYVGTTTGEMLKFRVDRDEIKDANQADRVLPVLVGYSRERFGMGVKSVLAVSKPNAPPFAIIGAGDGTVQAITASLFSASGLRAELLGSVTSIVPAHDPKKGYFACTSQSNWYYLSPTDFKAELRGTCHHDEVNDIIFPRDCSDLFVSCSHCDIRVWNANLREEVLRIQVPSLKCTCVGLTMHGGLIVSGWSDGKLRAFLPQSGKLAFVVAEAQPEGVTSLAMVNDDETRPPWRVITGGVDGRIRVWNVHSSYQAMLVSLKEHRKDVTSIAVTPDNRSFVSSSADGSCIIWDLVRLVRVGAVFAQTIFEGVVFHPDSSQILTCGSNNKLTYWDVYDGNAIRDVPASHASLKALDVRPEGDIFACVGADRILRLWSWDDGVVLAVGKGHSGTIKRVRISPDGRHIVTCASDGSIFVWKAPPVMAKTLSLAEGLERLRLPSIDGQKRPQVSTSARSNSSRASSLRQGHSAAPSARSKATPLPSTGRLSVGQSTGRLSAGNSTGRRSVEGDRTSAVNSRARGTSSGSIGRRSFS